MYRIGIYGSESDPDSEVKTKLDILAEKLAEYKDKVIIVNGSCPGVPLYVSKRCKELGMEIWGFSPAIDEDSHVESFPRDDITIYDRVFYVPPFFKLHENKWASYEYRNLVSTSHAHGGIICQGRWGTLNEFTNLVEMGKIAAVYEGTGGVADELRSFASKVKKDIHGEIIFDDDPQKLVSNLINLVIERNISVPDL